MGAAGSSGSDRSSSDESPLNGSGTAEGRFARRRSLVGGAVAAVLVAVAAGYIVGNSRAEVEDPLVDVVYCSVSTRPNDQEAPTLAGDLRIDWRTVDTRGDDRGEVEASGDGLTLTATFSSPYPPDGHTLGLRVTDSQGRMLHVTAYQLWQGPTDLDTNGFTGLHYAYDPVTGAELQYWCSASPTVESEDPT